MKTLIAASLLLALAIPAHAAEVRNTVPSWALKLDAKQYAAREAREAAKGEWFLIYDMWTCDVHNCGENSPPDEDYVYTETFITRKQCLTQSTHPGVLRNVYKLVENLDAPVGKISPRCVLHPIL